MLTRCISPVNIVAIVCAVALGSGCAPSRRDNGGPGDIVHPGSTGGGKGGGEDLTGPCDAGAIRCAGPFIHLCNEQGAAWTEGENCNLRNLVCLDGECVERPTEDGQEGGVGQGDEAGEKDPTEGGGRDEGGEGGGEAAVGAEGDEGDEGHEGGAGGCESRSHRCEGNTLMYCIDGDWVEQENCEDTDRACEEGQCIGCEAGAKACRGTRVVQCDEAGRIEETLEICAQGSSCVNGACVTLCGADSNDKASYQGCEYWAVDLDNADVDVPGGVSPAAAQFAVVVSNVNEEDVELVAWASDDGEEEREVVRTTVRGGEIGVLNLPARSLVGSGKGFKAYRISATQAVIAYQFNPLNNTETAFSNDASLLIPTNALGNEYFAVTGDGINQPGNIFNPEPMIWGAFVTIVGVSEEPVNVTVEASTAIQPPEGAGIQVRGRTVTASLSRYEVLSVHSLPDEGNPLRPPVAGNGNMSGTKITADGPIAVFSGNVAVSMPVRPGICCADHMEEQLWPVDSWGQIYIAARSLIRRAQQPESDFWRITGSVDGTELTYIPRRPSGAPERLDSGQSIEFEAVDNFIVEATQPIQVAQFLTSSQWVDQDGVRDQQCDGPGANGDRACTDALGYLATCVEVENFFGLPEGRCMPISDPALVLSPPTEQYRSSYVFLAPDDYNTDFINVIAPAATVVELDGEIIEAGLWRDVGEINGEEWRVATIVVADGRHTIESDSGVGLMVYGYDQDVSYGYPGGLNLEKFDAPPPRE